MQTFLPLSNFTAIAKLLDYRRLGKQRVEAYQILETLVGRRQGWRRHPAVCMWQGHEPILLLYGLIMCQEWKDRGFEENMAERFVTLKEEYLLGLVPNKPSWLGDERLHFMHQRRLLEKNFDHYSTYFSEDVLVYDVRCCDDCDYWWPTHERKVTR